MTDKLTWLEEVKKDAEYNYLKRLREQEADRVYEQNKASAQDPIAPALDIVSAPEVKKGK